MKDACDMIAEIVENSISRKEDRYVAYFVYRRSDGHGLWDFVDGKGYLEPAFDIWNLEMNGYKTKSAAVKSAERRVDKEAGMDLVKASVVKYELAYGPNERGCERPIYMKKAREYVIYAEDHKNDEKSA